MRRAKPILRIFVVLALAAGAVSAQEPAPRPVREHAGVSLVEIPVTVLDSSGKPIRGLTAADFTVTDDGKPVKLVGADVQDFSGIEVAAPGSHAPRSASTEVLPAARRRFLLLFDLSFATAAEITRIRDAGRKFVSEKIGPTDLAAVGTFSLLHGFRLLVTFTPDRAQLAAAADTLGAGDTLTNAGDPLELSAFLDTSLYEMNGASSSMGGKLDGLLAENARLLQEAARRNDNSFRTGQATQLLQSFDTLGHALSSVEGRKQIIYFSEGFDSRLLQGNASDRRQANDTADSNPMAAASQAELAVRGNIWEVDSQSRFGDAGLQSKFNALLDLFRRSDCVIHAVDLAGLTADGSASGASNKAGQDTLFAMANGTGGTLFKSGNDFSSQLDRLLEGESVVYVLAFTPSPTGHPEKFHPLKVRVARSGATVSARAGYFEPKPYSAQSVVEQNLSAADVIAAEIPVHDIAAEVFAVPFKGPDGARVPVIVRVPAGGLSAGGATGKLPIEIYGYAFDEKGKIPDFFTEKATLDLAQVHDRLAAGGLLYYASLRLPAGYHRIRVLVRNGASGAMGLAVADVNVPDFAGGKLQLSPPLFVGPASAGVVLRGRSIRSAVGGDETFPYLAGKDPFLPEQPAAFARNSDAKVCLYAYHLGAGTDGGPRLGGQILDSEGKVLSPANIALAGIAKADADGRATFLLDLKTGDLNPGSYSLRVMLQDPASGDARQTTAPFLVR